jgi:hypothetical protein
MKKLMMGVAAAICCLIMAAPVMAQVKIDGMITTDFFVFDEDAERYNPLRQNATQGHEGRTTTNINLPQALNRFGVSWTSDDKKVHGRIQLRYGSPTGVRGFGLQQAFDPEYAYIDYYWTPNFWTRFGRVEQTFAIMAPSQSLGQSMGHIVGASWGNVHGGTARDGIKGYFKFNDNVRLEIEMIDPDTDGGEAVAGGTVKPGGNGAAILEENVLPRLDMALNLKFGNFVIEPSFTYLKQKYEMLAAGEEDTVDIWGLALGMSAGFGPFKISGELTYGQNLGDGNYVGATGATALRYRNTANNSVIEDTDCWAAWIDMGFNFGPFEIHGIVGTFQYDNDGNPTNVAATEIDREKWMYGLNFPIKVTKNFTIKPEIMYYQDDYAMKDGTSALTIDQGSELVAGIQFQLVF